jgi:hypothetical protein
VYQIETDSETQNKTLYMAFPGPSPAYCLFREFREYKTELGVKVKILLIITSKHLFESTPKLSKIDFNEN